MGLHKNLFLNHKDSMYMCLSNGVSLGCYSFEELIKSKGGGGVGVWCIYIYICGELRKERSVIKIFK